MNFYYCEYCGYKKMVENDEIPRCKYCGEYMIRDKKVEDGEC